MTGVMNDLTTKKPPVRTIAGFFVNPGAPVPGGDGILPGNLAVI